MSCESVRLKPCPFRLSLTCTIIANTMQCKDIFPHPKLQKAQQHQKLQQASPQALKFAHSRSSPVNKNLNSRILVSFVTAHQFKITLKWECPRKSIDGLSVEGRLFLPAIQSTPNFQNDPPVLRPAERPVQAIFEITYLSLCHRCHRPPFARLG